MGRNTCSPSQHPNPSRHPAPPSPPYSLSSSRSQSSRISPSDTSLPASSSAGTSLPTSVAERNSNTAWLYRLLAGGSRILYRLVHFPLSFSTSAYRIFCYSGHALKRRSRVTVWHWHHQHWAVGRFFTHWRYTPRGNALS